MGTRLDTKVKRYEFLVQRADKSLAAGFYVEATAIIYSLLEERTYSLMKKLGLPYKEKNHKLFHCIEFINDAIQDHTIPYAPSVTVVDIHKLLKSELIESDLLKKINAWRSERNDIMHDLAKQNINYESLQSIAENGVSLFRSYTAFIMRFKKLTKST